MLKPVWLTNRRPTEQVEAPTEPRVTSNLTYIGSAQVARRPLNNGQIQIKSNQNEFLGK